MSNIHNCKLHSISFQFMGHGPTGKAGILSNMQKLHLHFFNFAALFSSPWILGHLGKLGPVLRVLWSGYVSKVQVLHRPQARLWG